MDPQELKSGCLWCPLFPFYKGFDKHAARYMRDANKIRSKAKEPHTIRSLNVRERPVQKVRVLFVGEAPGADEDRLGTPFIGRSGKLGRTAAEEAAELAPQDYAFANVLGCRPPRNRDPRKTEIRCCSYELIREIKAREPELVVVLGNFSMELLTGQTGITTFAGHMMKCTRPEFPGLDILACLHPAYVLRMDHELDKFAETFMRVKEYLAGDYTPLQGEGDYFTVTTLAHARKLLTSFKGSPKVTFDTETGSLTPFQDEFPRLLCFSFSDGPGVGYTIPYDHADSPWREGGPKAEERAELTELLRLFFADVLIPKVGQNVSFDRKHVRRALDVEVESVLRDTMLTHYVIDERKGTHGLKRLAFMYTGMGGYERPLEKYIKTHPPANPKRGGSYANIPGTLLFKYGAMDADVTYRVDDGLIAEPEYTGNPRLQRLAGDFLPELTEALADMEYTGAHVDVPAVGRLAERYEREMKEHEAKIAVLPKIKQFVADEKERKKSDKFVFNPGSATQLQKVLFGYYGLQPTELTNAGLDRLIARRKRLSTGGKKVDFQAVVQRAIENREWDLFTTKADVLHEYDRQGNDLALHILNYRTCQTIYGTFVKPVVDRLDENDNVHGSFLSHGTVSGRLASVDPNLQNIPDPERVIYVSRFGDEGVILSADYSQIELRIAASWFDSKRMIAAYMKGVDMHAQTAADIDRIPLEELLAFTEPVRKKKRSRAKRCNFAVLYQGGPPAVVRTLKKDGIFITVEEAQALIDNFYEVRPDLNKGILRLQAKLRRDGFVESFTGRRRRLPSVFSEEHELEARALRQGVNFPIQSNAADMTLMALILIHRILKAEGFRSRIMLTVHDSIIFDCHIDEVMEVATIAKQVMENLPELSDELLPGLDWSWLKVPIIADMEVGYSWATTVGFDPETVDTDELQQAMLEKSARIAS